jgi:Glycosyl hydrolase family 79 C-terminal beta domain
MDRREFVVNSLALSASVAGHSALAQDSGATAVTVSVHTDQPLASIAPDFMGLGFETSSVGRLGVMSRAARSHVELIRSLSPRGIIRIGGNTSDYARYSARDPAAASAYATVINDAVLKDLGGFLDATGWNLIWGFNLGRATEAEAVAEAEILVPIVGERLIACEIGNEPDLFVNAKHRGQYSYEAWLADYRRYKGALRARFPHLAFAGPDVAGNADWLRRFADDEGKDSVLLTAHYYREHQNDTSTIEKLLNPDPNLQSKIDQWHAASQSCARPYRICETNSFSGGGRPGVSDTMTGALWVLDFMYTLAANGCSGVNMETGMNHLDFMSSYSPIADDEHGHYAAKPEYYGMLAFSLGAKGKLLRTDVTTQSPEIKAYATRSDHGALAITLINKGATAYAADLQIAGPPAGRRATIVRLIAPSVDAKSGVTLGGAAVTSEGAWKATNSESTQVAGGKLSVRLPAYSAAICTVD